MPEYTLAILQAAAEHWDRALTVAFAIFGTLMSVIAYLFKRRMEAYDRHLEECRERAVTTGRMDERLKVVETELGTVRRSVHWMGNCIMVIGVKLGVGDDLPQRPN